MLALSENQYAIRRQLAQTGPDEWTEARVNVITADGEVTISFTAGMDFPEDTLALLNDDDEGRFLQFGLWQYEGDEQVLTNWTVTAVEPNYISAKMNFEDPGGLSLGDEPDTLFVQVQLGSFKSLAGRHLPSSSVYTIDIVAQYRSEQEAIVVERSTAATTSALFLMMAGSAGIGAFVYAAILGNVWSLVNGLQLVAFLPAFGLHFPANAAGWNESFVGAATFEPIDTKAIFARVGYSPEEKPFSHRFQQIQIDFVSFVPNLGMICFAVLYYALLVVLRFVLSRLGHRHRWIQATADRLQKHLYWNGLTRLFIQSYLEFHLLSLVALHKFDPQSPFVMEQVSSWLALVTFALTLVIPIALWIHLLRSRDEIGSKEFLDRKGVPLEGLAVDSKSRRGWVIMHPMTFFLRRAALAWSLVFLAEHLWLQISIQMFASLAMSVYLLHAKPMEAPRDNFAEVAKEYTTLVLTYILMHFSDYVSTEAHRDLRSNIGYLYVAVILAHCAVNLAVMLYDWVALLLLELRRRRAKKFIKSQAEELAHLQSHKGIVVQSCQGEDGALPGAGANHDAAEEHNMNLAAAISEPRLLRPYEPLGQISTLLNSQGSFLADQHVLGAQDPHEKPSQAPCQLKVVHQIIPDDPVQATQMELASIEEIKCED